MAIRSLSQAYLPHRTGSSRPARPAQMSDSAQSRLSGGIDPQKINEMSHETANVLLDRVHHSQDPALVRRVLTIVDTEGIDIIAELWSESEPESLPGILWRLYTLRSWMRARKDDLPRFWTLGEPAEGAASAITGVSEFPTADDIMRTADSILSGAFTGDFAVARERARAFRASGTRWGQHGPDCGPNLLPDWTGVRARGEPDATAAVGANVGGRTGGRAPAPHKRRSE